LFDRKNWEIIVCRLTSEGSMKLDHRKLTPRTPSKRVDFVQYADLEIRDGIATNVNISQGIITCGTSTISIFNGQIAVEVFIGRGAVRGI
jgi:hypothetical protein